MYKILRFRGVEVFYHFCFQCPLASSEWDDASKKHKKGQMTKRGKTKTFYNLHNRPTTTTNDELIWTTFNCIFSLESFKTLNWKLPLRVLRAARASFSLFQEISGWRMEFLINGFLSRDNPLGSLCTKQLRPSPKFLGKQKHFFLRAIFRLGRKIKTIIFALSLNTNDFAAIANRFFTSLHRKWSEFYAQGIDNGYIQRFLARFLNRFNVWQDLLKNRALLACLKHGLIKAAKSTLTYWA